MNTPDAKRKIEELVGRIDVLKHEIRHAHEQAAKYRSLNEPAHVREAEQDAERMDVRLRSLEQDLAKLKKFW